MLFIEQRLSLGGPYSLPAGKLEAGSREIQGSPTGERFTFVAHHHVPSL